MYLRSTSTPPLLLFDAMVADAGCFTARPRTCRRAERAAVAAAAAAAKAGGDGGGEGWRRRRPRKF